MSPIPSPTSTGPIQWPRFPYIPFNRASVLLAGNMIVAAYWVGRWSG